MHPEPASPLGQAFAAIIAMLIAAIAEHAAEHPMLAPGLRATIRRLESIAARLEAMVAAWEAGRPIPDASPTTAERLRAHRRRRDAARAQGGVHPRAHACAIARPRPGTPAPARPPPRRHSA